MHTGGTESAHFSHAVNAVEDYCRAMDTPIDLATAKDVFQSYLLRKKTVMEDCAMVLRQDKLVA